MLFSDLHCILEQTFFGFSMIAEDKGINSNYWGLNGFLVMHFFVLRKYLKQMS